MWFSRGKLKIVCFLTYKSDLQKPASRNSISRLNKSLQLMKYSYEQNSETFNCVLDTRRMSTSWAILNVATVRWKLQTAHWATESLLLHSMRNVS